jgi:hypothetical protein
MAPSLSVVVNDFYIRRTQRPIKPPETHTPLIVDADAPLAAQPRDVAEPGRSIQATETHERRPADAV